MTNYAHGHEAEKYAVEWLKERGYKIIALNWRDTRAEIDIVARHKYGPLRFIEVKYRQSSGQGEGFEYITPVKLRQMSFAAELYIAKEHYTGEYTLGALELSGHNYIVSGFIEELI